MTDVPPTRRLLPFRRVLPPTPSSGGSASGEPPVESQKDSERSLRRVLRAWRVPPPSDGTARLLASYLSETRRPDEPSPTGGRRLIAAPTLRLERTNAFDARRRLAISAGAAMVVPALAAALSWWSVAPVSAQEVLEHADRAHLARLADVVSPVIRQRLILAASTTAFPQDRGQPLAVTYDVWSDVVTRRQRLRVSPHTPAAAQLASRYSAVLTRNGLGSEPPLSARAFGGWRARVGVVIDRVERETLAGASDRMRVVSRDSGPVSEGAIIEATLVLRTEDWHPVQQIVLVQHAGFVERFEVTEDLFELLPRTAVPATLFGGREVGSAPVGMDAATPSARVRPIDLQAIELGVLFALHQIGADLGEQLTIVRGAGVVRVRGVVETRARSTEITNALARLPHVQVELETGQDAAEALRQAGGASVPAQHHVTQAASTSNTHGLLPMVEAHIRARHALAAASGAHDEPAARDLAVAVNGFIHEVSAAAEAALAEAWAFRRLEERYPLAAQRDMSRASRRLLGMMTRDHLASTQGHLARVRRALEAVNTTESGTIAPAQLPMNAPTVEPLEEPQLAAGQLFVAVVDIERRVTVLLGTESDARPGLWAADSARSSPDDGPADLSAPSSLRALLDRLAQVDRRLEATRRIATAMNRPVIAQPD